MRVQLSRGTAAIAAIILTLTITASAHGDDAKQAGRRENRQKQRIEQGIKHGQLTKEEVSGLQAEEAKIKSMQKSFASDEDGKLTKEDSKKLEDELNNASLLIWAERHDTNGNQRPEERLGKDVVANSDITKEIESGDLTASQAHTFLDDERKLVRMKRRLSTDDLTETQRTKLQNQYNDLLNKYFEVKTPAPKQ